MSYKSAIKKRATTHSSRQELTVMFVGLSDHDNKRLGAAASLTHSAPSFQPLGSAAPARLGRGRRVPRIPLELAAVLAVRIEIKKSGHAKTRVMEYASSSAQRQRVKVSEGCVESAPIVKQQKVDSRIF